MANEKSAIPAKFDKKSTRHLVEKAIEHAIAGMAKEKELSKQLHKKIKKAGKLVAEGLHEELEALSQEVKKEATLPKTAAKKVVDKKVAVKKVAVKKVAVKKAMVKKVVKK